jgi:hypothetical protein
MARQRGVDVPFAGCELVRGGGRGREPSRAARPVARHSSNDIARVPRSSLTFSKLIQRGVACLQSSQHLMVGPYEAAQRPRSGRLPIFCRLPVTADAAMPRTIRAVGTVWRTARGAKRGVDVVDVVA